jgi:SpoVK/Ycf46/Vps4 family AAA+-type ATPase
MFSKEARDYGIAAPRGILLVGAPGTGKSLFAKAISNEMNQPLLKMDMTAQRSKWFGETGQTMIRALKTAHAIQPAILWIDEIDKSISRSEGMSMHEESAGTLGTLLTDMEEKPGLFFLATCNNPVNLPPELLSRFQKIFFVDLPNESERSEIFSIQIAGVNRDPKSFDLSKLAEKAPGYSGREIRNIIGESLSIAFDENREFNTDLIINQISKITPVSVQKKSEIESMRAWSAKNAENASEIAPVKTESGSRSLEL